MNLSQEQIRKGCIKAIRNHLQCNWSDEKIVDECEIAIEVFAEKIQDRLSTNIASGITQITQGSQSISIDNTSGLFKIDNDIRQLLPLPFVKMW